MKKYFVALILILMPMLASAQDNAKKKAYYFYGEQCPHCKKVDEFFQANGIYDKYDITKLEFSNPFNARLLMKFGDVFNSEFKGSVPAIAFGDKFIVGDQPIMDNFVREIDAAENASNLPDPEKIGNTTVNTEIQQPTSAETPAGKGNKKNIFPVILVAIILAGGGALIFVNLKKTKE